MTKEIINELLEALKDAYPYITNVAARNKCGEVIIKNEKRIKNDK